MVRAAATGTILAFGLAFATSALAADPAPPVPPAPPSWADLRHEAQKMNADIGKIVSPNGIDAAGYVPLNGVRQWVAVRGQDKAAPLLVYFHGGPGGALSDASYIFQRPWEDYFTVVQWDQRGFGRSNIDADMIKGSVTKEQYVADAIALIEHLRTRFGQKKVIVIGQSWGSLLGLEVAHRRPDLLYALVTVGQVAAWEGNFEETRRLLTELAKSTGDTALLKKMTDLGPLPRSTESKGSNDWIGVVQGEMINRGYSWHNSLGDWGPRLVTAAKLSPTVTDADLAAAATPHPEQKAYVEQVVASLSGWDAEKDIGTRLAVPWVLLQGDWDWQTPTTRARVYFDKVCAPWKKYIAFHQSGHVLTAEEPGRTIVTLVDDVLPAVSGKAPAGAVRCAR